MMPPTPATSARVVFVQIDGPASDVMAALARILADDAPVVEQAPLPQMPATSPAAAQPAPKPAKRAKAPAPKIDPCIEGPSETLANGLKVSVNEELGLASRIERLLRECPQTLDEITRALGDVDSKQVMASLSWMRRKNEAARDDATGAWYLASKGAIR